MQETDEAGKAWRVKATGRWPGGGKGLAGEGHGAMAGGRGKARRVKAELTKRAAVL